MFSDFERYALSAPVPALGLPRLENPSTDELAERCLIISYDIIRSSEGEDGLVAILTQLGTFGVTGDGVFARRRRRNTMSDLVELRIAGGAERNRAGDGAEFAATVDPTGEKRLLSLGCPQSVIDKIKQRRASAEVLATDEEHRR